MYQRALRNARFSVALAGVLLAAPSVAGTAAAAAPATMSVAVDASEATRGILHVHEQIPVEAGALTLVYPKWIPGEHAPDGPIVNVAGITVAAGGVELRWLRDPVDLYALHVDVPPGVSALDVNFDFVGAPFGNYSSTRLASANMLVLTWHQVLLTPDVADERTLTIVPSITLPGPEWSYATALDGAVRTGATVRFAPVTMDQLVDSPLDAGTNVRRWPLGSIDGAPVDIAVFADAPEQLEAADATIDKLRALVAEAGAIYRARHFNHYTFLLTVSDVLPGEGVEHHQSSDDGTPATFLIDDDERSANGDLLGHEFNHSWNGKYRRPADLATPNLEAPMHTGLLWVYEGMTQFYGQLLAERSGIWTAQQWRDSLAFVYAVLDATPGRATRPLLDTAVSAPFLYGAPSQWESLRRGTDFYDEGNLLWLEADVTIRRLSGGRRSLDDLARAFFGGTSTGPLVVPYTRDDLIAALNAVQPYDWRAFFAARVDAIAPHPPAPFEAAGWRLAFHPAMSGIERSFNADAKRFEARFSIGISGTTDGTIVDVVPGSPAASAGLAPGDKIVGIDARPPGSMQGALDTALRFAQRGTPLNILILSGGTYRTVTVAYAGGPRYPTLERVPDRPDLLSVIGAPLARR